MNSVWDIVSTNQQILDVLNGKPVEVKHSPSLIEIAKKRFYLGGSRRMRELYIERADGDPTLLANDPFVSIDDPKKNTDYDFYATYTSELMAELIEMGFVETQYSAIVRKCRERSFLDMSEHELEMIEQAADAEDYALDDEAVAILSSDHVQIVLRKDALFYKRVFDNIDHDIYDTYLWKSSPHKTAQRQLIQPFFNMLFKIAHANEGK